MNSTKRQAPPEPRLDDWCHEERLDLFERDLLAARDSLLWTGQLKSVLRGWIRRQIVNEVMFSGSFDPISDVENQADCPPNWSQELHDCYLKRNEALLAWATHHWGHTLESLYLERKTEFDVVTFQMIRVSNAGVCRELYHRIKEGENTFQRLALDYGEGPERFNGGKIKNKRIKDLEPALVVLLSGLKTFEIQPPRALQKQFILYQLLNRSEFSFDQKSRAILLMDQLKCWEAPLLKRLSAHLMCKG